MWDALIVILPACIAGCSWILVKAARASVSLSTGPAPSVKSSIRLEAVPPNSNKLCPFARLMSTIPKSPALISCVAERMPPGILICPPLVASFLKVTSPPRLSISPWATMPGQKFSPSCVEFNLLSTKIFGLVAKPGLSTPLIKTPPLCSGMLNLDVVI